MAKKELKKKKGSTQEQGTAAHHQPLPANEEHINWEEKANEYLNDLKRSQADFENYKRRQAETQKNLEGYLTEKLVRDLTPVLDNFSQAIAFVPKEQRESPWLTGITYIHKQLLDALSQHGLTMIEVKIGDPFDPTIHEAIESEGNKGEKVTQVLQPGYKIGKRVIKPAKVRVN